ncbi:hypothetical protein WA556_000207 [Blastocystis sp. ATCC 50177/Nand II]
MGSSSFGEWYEEQKKDQSEQPSSSGYTSWIPSIFQRNQTPSGDVESVGLLSGVQSVGTYITDAGDRMKEVLGLLALALVFFAIAYFIGLPTLILRPAKFAISFTMGSFMVLGALARFQGTNRFFSSIFQPERLPKTVLYIVSLLLSVLCAVVWKSYVGTVASSLLQVGMLAVFVLESFPAGSRITSLMIMSVKKLLSLGVSVVSRFVRCPDC